MNLYFKRIVLTFSVMLVFFLPFRSVVVNANPLIILGVEVTAEAVVYLGCATLSVYNVYTGKAPLSDKEMVSFKSKIASLKDQKENFITNAKFTAITWSIVGWAKIKAIIDGYSPVNTITRNNEHSYTCMSSPTTSIVEDYRYIPLKAGTYTINCDYYLDGADQNKTVNVTIYDGGGLCFQTFTANGLAQVYLEPYNINSATGTLYNQNYVASSSRQDGKMVDLSIDFSADAVVPAICPDSVWDKAKSLPVDGAVGTASCPIQNVGTIDAPVYAPTKDYTWGDATTGDWTDTVTPPADTVVDTNTGLIQGILDWLTDFLGKLIDALKELAIFLFVPSSSFFVDAFKQFKDEITGKFGIDLSSFNSIMGIGSKNPLQPIHFSILGNDCVIEFSIVEKIVPIVHSLSTGLTVFGLAFMNYRKVIWIIRGSSPTAPIGGNGDITGIVPRGVK